MKDRQTEREREREKEKNNDTEIRTEWNEDQEIHA